MKERYFDRLKWERKKERKKKKGRERENASNKLKKTTKDEILTSLKEWKNEREAWGSVSGLIYAHIECKHTESEKRLNFNKL